ncbi:hypothetical protein [Kordia sp.]|uniref:hypothetical protein n=1 Tax=Kordia sp. TaxID=1965332 RepID=UPI003D6BC0A3
MIANNKPFQLILDAYNTECFTIYCVLRSLKGYPAIYYNDYTDEEGMMHTLSFAFLCERFVYHITKNQGNYVDEYPELIYELFLETDVATFEEELEKTTAIIVKDIKTLFPSEKLVLSFFGTIFKMETKAEPFEGSYMDALDFYQNYIH